MPKLQKPMDVRLVAVGKIKPAAYNPRKELKPGDPEYESLKLAIETHGFVDPLVWNEKTGNLVGGHQRFNILVNEFGASEVWCSVVNIPDPKAEMSLNISLNKNMGEWDFPKLQQVLFKFQDDPKDSPFRLATGFNPIEFQQIIDWQAQTTGADVLEKNPEERLGAYEAGVIKQIVLYFTAQLYPQVIVRLASVRENEKVDDNTEAFVRLLDFYEKNQAKPTVHPKAKAGRSKR